MAQLLLNAPEFEIKENFLQSSVNYHRVMSYRFGKCSLMIAHHSLKGVVRWNGNIVIIDVMPQNGSTGARVHLTISVSITQTSAELFTGTIINFPQLCVR